MTMMIRRRRRKRMISSALRVCYGSMHIPPSQITFKLQNNVEEFECMHFYVI
jgi:hypothetical protein